MRWRIVHKRSIETAWPFQVQMCEEGEESWEVVAMERTYAKAEKILYELAVAERELIADMRAAYERASIGKLQ